MTTGAELIASVRELLHDALRGKLVATYHYPTASIANALMSASKFTYCELVMKYKATRHMPSADLDFYRLSPRMTIGRLIQLTAAASGSTSGANVPPDYYRLECGLMLDDTYVPAYDVFSGERMRDRSPRTIFARGGKFFGIADIAVYWAFPTEPIADSSTLLVEFPATYYNAIKYLACANLLAQEQQSNMPRYTFFLHEYARRVQSLR